MAHSHADHVLVRRVPLRHGTVRVGADRNKGRVEPVAVSVQYRRKGIVRREIGVAAHFIERNSLFDVTRHMRRTEMEDGDVRRSDDVHQRFDPYRIYPDMETLDREHQGT